MKIHPRPMRWLEVAAFLAWVCGSWWAAGLVQQRWSGTEFSRVPYGVFLALLAVSAPWLIYRLAGEVLHLQDRLGRMDGRR